MRQQSPTVNRKWINEMYRQASGRGEYFIGTTTREIAHAITKSNDLHPVFVGKIDQLLCKLLSGGFYAIADGRLVRSDNIAVVITVAAQLRTRRRVKRHAAKQTAWRKRVLQSNWHDEALTS